MAIILKALNLSASKKAGLPQPIIFCQPDTATDDMAVSLNVVLSEKLVTVKPNRRTMRLEQCFR